MRALALLAALFVASPALAGGGTATAPLPPEPAVDFTSLPATASARPDNLNGDPHQAYAQLLVDRTVVKPGEAFRLGVRLVPNAHWHSYWKSPGDVGMPLEVAWQLPEGATTTPIQFPVPQRFDDSGIVSYGYDGPMMLFTEVTLPADTPDGTVELGAQPIIEAKSQWLVCEAQCIKGEVKLADTIAVAAAGGGVPTPWAPLFDHYERHHPVPMSKVTAFAVEGALDQTAYRPEDAFEVAFRIVPTGDQPLDLDLEAGTWPVFVPILDMNELYPFEYESKATDDGGLVVVVKGDTLEVEELPKDSRIGGLFQVGVGDEIIRAEYSIPVPWVAPGTAIEKIQSPLFALAAGEPPSDLGPDPGEGGPADRGPDDRANPEPPAQSSLAYMLLLAFAGGLLLNIMPCVFPVISLKAFGLVQKADKGAWAQKRAGLAYTAGIMVSFLSLAAVVVVLKGAIGGVGWGFQFQSPLYVAILTTIVFAFGLSLFGVFEIPAIGADAAANAADQGGVAGDFLNGVFATLLATPCSAPFLGPAIGFAFSQSAPIVVLFFAIIGFGLAAPFLLIAFVPALFRILPRPGAWMETFKQLMGFTLIATTIWLIDVLADQVGPDAAVRFLGFLVFVALGSWIFGRWGGLEQERGRQMMALSAGMLVAAVGGWWLVDLEVAEASESQCETGCVATGLDFSEEVPFQPFSETCVEELHGETLFIDFTASWCLTCKVNERTVLASQDVREAMAAQGVVPLKADWTKRDPVITEWLLRYDRAGVPFYLVIPAKGDPIPLPEIITTGIVLDALERAREPS